MALHTLWFLLDLVFWAGFFVLEGFDFGVGVLHSFVGRSDGERRQALNTVGPFWDGNEVWLIVAGAVIFAAFPAWYATMFSSLYLALVVILLALIIRGVSFEFRGKLDDPTWRGAFRWTMTIGSALIPLLLGTGLGDLLHGLPFDAAHNYTGTFWDLLTPYGLYTGVTMLVLSLLAGAMFLAVKTTGPVAVRSNATARALGPVATLVVIGFVIWTREVSGQGVVPTPTAILAIIAVAASAWLATTDRLGWAFAATAVAIVTTVTSLFEALYPNVMVSSTDHAFNLTVSNASSNSYSLRVMTVVAVIFTPFVLAYTAWNYWVFRKRVGAPPQPDPAEGTDGGSGSGSAAAGAVGSVDETTAADTAADTAAAVVDGASGAAKP
jgi:cytochrome d ubiquinol oxidase subunit II